MRQAAVIAYFLTTLAGVALTACSSVPLNDKANAIRLECPELSQTRAGMAEMISKFPAYENAKLQTYVQQVANKLIATAPATDLPIRVQVLDSPGFFAYSFGHGDIVIARGLLIQLQSENQLAAVLAHEIGHIILQHQLKSVQTYQRIRALEDRLSSRIQSTQAREALGTLSFAKLRAYSRENEIEADTWSERLLHEAGYPPSAMGDVLQGFLNQEARWDKDGFIQWDFPENELGGGVFATHPSADVRLVQARKRQPATREVNSKPDPAYQAAIDGTRLGLPIHLGIEHDQQYAHPERNFGFTVPEGWYVFGAGDRLGLAPRDNMALITINLLPENPKGTALDALKKIARGSPLVSQEHHAGEGFTYETALITLPDGSRQIRLAVLDLGKQRLQLIAEAGEKTVWEKTEQTARQLLQAIRPISAAEAKTVQAAEFKVSAGKSLTAAR